MPRGIVARRVKTNGISSLAGTTAEGDRTRARRPHRVFRIAAQKGCVLYNLGGWS
jgi:hypothetical protein